MKKGTIQIELIVVFVIVLAFLFIMGVFLLRAKDSFNTIEDDAPCAADIKAHSLFASATGESMLTGITCPTNLAYVESDDKEHANYVIAEEMARCWGIWGRGNMTLFRDEGIFCHICSFVSVPKIDKIEGLPKYLAEHEYKPGLKYMDYLTGQKKGDYFADEEFQAHANDGMLTEQSLGVVFVHIKERTMINKILSRTITSPERAIMGGVVGGSLLVGYTAAGVLSGGWLFVATAAGGASGGLSGLIGALTFRPHSDTMSIVYVKPLTKEGVEDLNCAYAPVKEE